MSKQLSVSESIQLGNDLRAAAQDLAAREEKIKADLRTRTQAAELRDKHDLDAARERLEADLAREQAEFDAARARHVVMHERRVARLKTAYPSSKRQGLERINRQEGRSKYPLQKGLLDTEKNRTEYLKQNDATLAEFQRHLEDAGHSLARTEQLAKRKFRGYGEFRRMLRRKGEVETEARDEYQMLERLHSLQARAESELAQLRRSPVALLLQVLPVEFWVVVFLLVAFGLAPGLRYFGMASVTPAQAAAAGGGLLVLFLAIYFYSKHRQRGRARTIADSLRKARDLWNRCPALAESRHMSEANRIQTEAEQTKEHLQQEWASAQERATAARESWPQEVEQKFRRVAKKQENVHRNRTETQQKHYKERIERLKAEALAREQQLTDAQQKRLERIQAEFQTEWLALENEWRQRIEPLRGAVEAANRTAADETAPWEKPLWEAWSPPTEFRTAARFGQVSFDMPPRPNLDPAQPALPKLPALSLPLTLVYPEQGSIVFETKGAESSTVIGALNNIVFRLLASTPAGKASFTIIDPIRLGQNFATVMHLADYEENLINGRIWTQPNQIEEKLGEINEHIEKVIQMYLRNEYPTLAEYNREAGNIAEKYHFLVVADFPANFSELAARRLLRIAASGARCGVFVLAHWDHRHPLPPDFLPEELRKSSVCVSVAEGALILENPKARATHLQLDAPPDPEFATWFLHKVGDASRGSSRVEVPFSHVAPDAREVWSLKTDEELRVPIGRSGATKLQHLSLGRGTRQHVLIAGKTGSGKSTLFHGIITNLALWCSPQEVEFYLVDFKKGVEFKCYASLRLPHARVVAIESDREFGLSVLERVDEELRRRGDLFRHAGVQDLAGYKATPGSEPMPRCLLMIDEFQELFVEDDRTAQAANVLLDRIVRQGRAFGIHVILGSQTLGGAYTLARATMGQMVVRIALQCNEADAYLIMDENNAAPRLLSRPGEGIYNDRAGAIEGNSPFQAVWLSEDERDARLQQIRTLAEEKQLTQTPVVFEGNAPSDIADNTILQAAIHSPSRIPTAEPRIWLGLPNAIKGPTEAVFHQRAGSNLLVVGQRDEAVLAILMIGLVSIASEHREGPVRFMLLDGSTPNAQPSILARLIHSFPFEITVVRPGESLAVLHQLAEELHEERPGRSGRTFLFVHRLQNFRKLRAEDDFGLSVDNGDAGNPAADLQTIVTEGPGRGMHVIVTVDTYNNVMRWLGRKTLSEFAMRVLFQMSASDSASLCDDPRASLLGLHRALLFNEQQGYMETFRPYALPSGSWFDEALQKLTARRMSQISD